MELLQKHIFEFRDSFDYAGYRAFLEKNQMNALPYHEIAPQIEPLLLAAETVYMWGMSFSSLSDVYHVLSLLHARNMSPTVKMMISHQSSVGKIWIEPMHTDNGIDRRCTVIKSTVDDYTRLKAEVRSYPLECIPVSNGFAVDDKFVFIRFYNFVKHSQSNDVFPLELITDPVYGRKNLIIEGEAASQFVQNAFLPSYNSLYNPTDIRSFFGGIE